MKKISLGDKKISIPEKWDEISLQKFSDIVKENLDSSKSDDNIYILCHLSILTDTEFTEWFKIDDSEDLNDILDIINFSFDPRELYNNKPDRLIINNIAIDINNIKLSYGQKIMIYEIISKTTNGLDKDGLLYLPVIYPEIIAIYIYREYYKEQIFDQKEKYKYLLDRIRMTPCTELVHIANFFLKNFIQF